MLKLIARDTIQILEDGLYTPEWLIAYFRDQEPNQKAYKIKWKWKNNVLKPWSIAKADLKETLYQQVLIFEGKKTNGGWRT